jgi:hypothetical protein
MKSKKIYNNDDISNFEKMAVVRVCNQYNSCSRSSDISQALISNLFEGLTAFFGDRVRLTLPKVGLLNLFGEILSFFDLLRDLSTHFALDSGDSSEILRVLPVLLKVRRVLNSSLLILAFMVTGWVIISETLLTVSSM